MMIKAKLPRPLAVIIAIVGFLSIVALLLWAILPTAVSEAGKLVSRIPVIIGNIVDNRLIATYDQQLNGAISEAAGNAINFVSDSSNWPTLLGGVFQIGVGVLSGAVGFVIVVILSIYFMVSLESLKDYLGLLVAKSKRESFRKLTDQIALSVGRWVMGQTSIALLHSILIFTLLTILGSPFALLLSLTAFLLALIPLVGPASAGVLVVGVTYLSGAPFALIVAIYYLVYLQIEAYLIGPRVMQRAVSVPACPGSNSYCRRNPADSSRSLDAQTAGSLVAGWERRRARRDFLGNRVQNFPSCTLTNPKMLLPIECQQFCLW
jgi:predicted PurR-regulated permease PerM